MVRDRLKESWITLGRRERERRRWGKEIESESESQNVLSRMCWETRRLMSWWIEEMISHFWINVINLNLMRFMDQLNTIKTNLNFKSLGILHTHFLFKVSFGLCLFEIDLLKSLLKKCLRLSDELDCSEFELFPPLLFQSDQIGHQTPNGNPPNEGINPIKVRLKKVKELGIEFKSDLKDFFEILSRINHQPEKPSTGLGGISQTIDQSTIMMGGMGGSIPGWLESLGNGDEGDEVLRESRLEVSVFKRMVMSELLSKLDFSGFFSDPSGDDNEGLERVLDGI
ncbi:uncharacterized protein MELLADRAFT_72575 [Melampsora larici-populina 98AG31]|uniref:Gamma tubulin complex component C-terminal domain-containing protein n=1 Tax=Melampsora larici-populina (strain 98AG31 / pathotype 3-4-7) TaxID=747676 RepID=F4RW48_MELLP|nr:uncharacterized protein MELLADRAFT_72575 [Melampsora larici-populina 98AG31]EGG03217.1 hypothetical protein MELLADRAFT_72575 [Melampsora larici-populina 98AG31]